jgi:hypothetical protein
MKLGIFGDSFASAIKFNPSPSWVDILAYEHEVTNHAVDGSNLYHSVEEIKTHHENYDKLILVVTQPGRLKIPDWIPVDKIEDKFITGKLDRKIAEKVDNNIVASYAEAGSLYFTYLQNVPYDNYVHNLMLNDIRNLRQDVILIPGFLNSFPNISGCSMHYICAKEHTAWNLDWSAAILDFEDIRNCHMTIENNAIFATKAKEWLNGKPVHINLDDFVTTTNKDFYLKQR